MTTSPTDSSDPASARDELRRLLLAKSVLVGKDGEFTLASGATSNFYVDCRLTTLDARGARLVGRLGWELVQGSGIEVAAVGGLTMGADPVALAIAIASDSAGASPPLHAFSVRKEAKGHGRGRRIEGNFAEGMPVVVVDDVITTGGSTLKAIEAIEEAGGRVPLVVVLVDREEGGREAIEARGPKVLSIFGKSELLAASPA